MVKEKKLPMSLHSQFKSNISEPLNMGVRSFEHYKSSDLQDIFEACFEERYATLLVGGADEPLYQPNCDIYKRHVVYYRYDYFASALHEIAHWCIAGAKRRQNQDYGYWYLPDGRNSQEQAKFEEVEAKPQAIECAFSKACGVPFRVSIDNLSNDVSDLSKMKTEQDFTDAVNRQLKLYQRNGFPPRAQAFLNALKNYYQALMPRTSNE